MSVEFSRDDVEQLEHSVAFSGFFRMERYRLRHQLFQGGWSAPFSREVFERGNAVVVLPFDPVSNQILLIEQFRIGAWAAGQKPWLLELIAGIFESGESPEQVALREGVEEAGCQFSELMPIAEYLISPGGSSEKIWLFCGRFDATQVSQFGGLAAESEDIRVHLLPLATAYQWLDQGKFDNAAPIMALLWLKLNEAKVRGAWET